MKKLLSQIKTQVPGILIGAVTMTVIFSAGILINNSSSENTSNKVSTKLSSERFAKAPEELIEKINTEDIQGLSELITESMGLYVRTDDNTIQVNEAEFIQWMNSGNYGIEMLSLMSEEEVTEIEELLSIDVYQAFVSADGMRKILIIRNGDEISAIYLMLPELIDVSDKNTSDPEVEDEKQPSAETTPFVKLTYWDNGPYVIEAGKSATIATKVYAQNLNAQTCTLTMTLGKTTEFSKTVKWADSNSSTIDLFPTVSKAGSYKSIFTCVKNGTEYRDSKEVKVAHAPNSYCDDKDFNVSLGDRSYQESKSKFIGEWKGCTKNPWGKPYEVEFEFRSNGTYSSRNIEKIVNPDTLRKHPALYYGTDEDQSKKTFEINDQNEEGELKGKIIIAFGVGTTNIGDMSEIRISEDGNSMYFEVRKNGYGPIKYILSRQ